MNFAPECIGVGKYTGELAQWLATREHDVEVITAWPHYPGFTRFGSVGSCDGNRVGAVRRVYRSPLLLGREGRGVWRLLAPLSFALAAAPLIIWRALRWRPDIVLCVEPTLLAAPAAVVAARLSGAKLALHVQDLEVDAAFAVGHLRGTWTRAAALGLERRILRAFDCIVTISDAMGSRLVAKGLPSAKISVVRNWIGAPTSADVVNQAVRDRLGIGADEKVVLYAGHLGCKQGIPLLVEAVQRLACRRAVRMVIVGEGPMTGLVETACQQIPGLVHLPLQDEATHRLLLDTADVHVLPQAAAAADLVFPSKLGLMLASGRPVVVTAGPQTELARWLAGAATIVPPGDPELFAAGIEHALDELSPASVAQALALSETLQAERLLPAFEAILLRLIEQAPLSAAIRTDWQTATDSEAIGPQHA